MTITEFLEARISEDEAAARAAAESTPPASWGSETSPCGSEWEAYEGMVAGPADSDGFVASLWDDEGSQWLRMHNDAAKHIARHDPSRVLAECAAKRAIIAAHGFGGSFLNADGAHPYCRTCGPNIGPIHPCPTVRALAAVYKDHADYRQEWAA